MPVESDLHFKAAIDALSGTVSQPVSQAEKSRLNAEEAEQPVKALGNTAEVLLVIF